MIGIQQKGAPNHVTCVTANDSFHVIRKPLLPFGVNTHLKDCWEVAARGLNTIFWAQVHFRLLNCCLTHHGISAEHCRMVVAHMQAKHFLQY